MHDSAKYLIHAAFAADGVVERNDVVGAIYGQTEGLLGEELELRRLQESSKLGRIDVEVETSGGQSVGEITIATSLDRVETATLAAALETIDRVGPCRATIEVTDLEDVRAARRREVIERAERLLIEEFEETTSDAIVAEVRRRVATADVTTYEGLPAGPRVGDADAVVVVEGRADVQTVLAAGVKNAIAVEGTDVPDAVAELTADRTTTAFLDGDRGGELILRELCQVGDVDSVAFAPAGRSVEDLSRSEVHDALRNKVAVDAIEDPATVRDVAEAARTAASNAIDAPPGDGAPGDGATASHGASGGDAVGRGDAPTGDARPADVRTDAAATSSDGARPDGTATRADVATADGRAEHSASQTDGRPVSGQRRLESGPGAAAEGVDDGDAVAATADERTHTDGGTAASQPASTSPDGDGEQAAGADAATADGPAAEPEPTAIPSDDADAASAGPGGREAPATDTERDAGDAAPETLRGHVEAVRDAGTVRLLDEGAAVLDEADSSDAFETLETVADAPAWIVLDDELEQRLLDLAAQRGVRQVVARSLGSFTKRPTDVRIRTMEQLQAG